MLILLEIGCCKGYYANQVGSNTSRIVFTFKNDTLFSPNDDHIKDLVSFPLEVLTFVAENTEAETLHQIIDNNCSDEVIIVTDAYKSYAGLNKKYNHVVVKHEDDGYVTKVGDYKFYTQNIENFWSILVRRYICTYHYIIKSILKDTQLNMVIDITQGK